MSNNQSQPNQSHSAIIHVSNLIDQNKYTELEHFLNQVSLQANELIRSFFLVIQRLDQLPNYLKLIEFFLKHSIDANIPIIYQKGSVKIEEHDNISLLMLAIMMNDIELTKLLLDYRASPDQEDSNNLSAMVYSILYDHNDDPLLLTLLINNEGNLNCTAKFNMGDNKNEEHSLFTLSCSKGLYNITQVLIEAHVNVNYKSKPSENTGLHYAVKSGNVALIKLILSSKDNDSDLSLEIQNAEGMTAYDIARTMGGETYNCFTDFMSVKNYENINKQNVNKIYGDLLNNPNYNNNVPRMINNINSNSANIKYYTSHQNYNPNNINDSDYMNSANNSNYANYSNEYSSTINSANNVNSVNYMQIANNNPNLDYNNEDELLNEINNEKINIIKKQINSKIYKKIIPDSNHLEIPVIFHRQSGSKELKLNSFLKRSNGTVLCLDLTDKAYELELLKNKLNSELQDKIEMSKKYEIAIQDKERKIKEKSNLLEETEKKLKNMQILEDEQIKEIAQLTEKKNELYEKLPQKHFLLNDLKNLPQKEFCELKFAQNKIEDNYISSTLQKDLNDYKEYIHNEMDKKKEQVDKILIAFKEVVNSINNTLEVKIFGSYAHNLAVPWSNLDIILVKTDNTYPNTEESNYIISRLAADLSKQTWVTKLQKIDAKVESANYSTIRLITSQIFGEMNVNITIQIEQNVTNLQSNELIQNYMKDYPILEPLILALKTILRNANLNNPLTGGLSSYGLILLVVSFLQSKLDVDNLDNSNENLLGKVFFGFLGHYGIFFDYQKYAIFTHKDRGSRDIQELENNYNFGPNQHEFVIIDPLNPKNNVAKVSHQFMNLKMAFMIAYMVAREDCECGCHYGKAVYFYQNHDIEHCILKRMFNSVKRFTDNK